MSYLTICGIPVPVSKMSQRVVRFGAKGFSFSGRVNKAQRAWVREWTCETTPQTTDVAEAFRALIDGRGHVFAGDDLYASTGLSFDAGHTIVAGWTGGAAKYGDWLTNGASGGTVSTGFASGYSVAYWLYASTGWLSADSQWHHVTQIRSAGGALTKYDNGVTTSGAVPLSLGSGGVVTIAGTTNAAFDDLMLLDAPIPATWAPLLAATTQAFAELPYLVTGGDFGGFDVLGEVQDSEAFTLNGVAQERITFTLTEVL